MIIGGRPFRLKAASAFPPYFEDGFPLLCHQQFALYSVRVGIKSSLPQRDCSLLCLKPGGAEKCGTRSRLVQAPRRHKSSSLQQLRERQLAPQGPLWRHEAKNDLWLMWIHSSMAGKGTWIKATNVFGTWLLQEFQLEVRWQVLTPMPKDFSEALLTPFHMHLPIPHF